MGISKKTLQAFLNDAVENNVIDRSISNRLIDFCNSEQCKRQGWANLSGVLGGVAAFTIVLGIILIIASNWASIGDGVKVFGLLTIMGLSHYIGLMLHRKGYEKLSISMHLIGCGLIYAGIGLVAQIFNLKGDPATPFLIYSVLVTPMVFILRSEILSFTVYLSLFGFYYKILPEGVSVPYSYFIGMTATAFAVYVSRVDYMKWTGGLCAAVVIVLTYLMGFIHELPKQAASMVDVGFDVFVGVSVIWLSWFILVNRGEKLLSLSLAPSVVLITLFSVLSFIFDSREYTASYDSIYKFGSTTKLYWDNYLLTITAWLAYFSIAAGAIVYGTRNYVNSSTNLGVALLGIGIYTRFIDLVGDMLSLGQNFLVLGLSFLALTYFLENWRKNLVSVNKES